MKFLPVYAIITFSLCGLGLFPFAESYAAVTYTLNRVTNPSQDQSDAYSKITTAMDSAVSYYNKYTTLTKTLDVNYKPDVQTADASSNGTIRFGSNRSYMVVHTAMHEIAHTIGIGTTTEYQSMVKNGIFTGSRATAMLREILNDPDTLLHGDSQHFWPYGLNYASEVKSKQDLINHCKIVNEMYKDMFKEEFFRACRLRSKVDGRYMAASKSGTLILSKDMDSSSLITMIALGDHNTFRLEFGNKVLDIPNESKTAGAAASLYTWNGGLHQRTIFEFDKSQNDPDITRIKMAHNGLYLRADGDKIIQDNGSVSKESQYWELIIDKRVKAINHSSTKNSLHGFEIINGYIKFGAVLSKNEKAIMKITDLRGRVIKSEAVNTNEPLLLPTKHFAEGIYMVIFHVEGQRLCSSLIVN